MAYKNLIKTGINITGLAITGFGIYLVYKTGYIFPDKSTVNLNIDTGSGLPI